MHPNTILASLNLVDLRRCLFPSVFLIPFTAQAQFTASLTPETNRAFEEYVTKAESQMIWRAKPASNDISVKPTLGKAPLDIADGMIHDWTGFRHRSSHHGRQSFARIPELCRLPDHVQTRSGRVKLLAQDGPHWKTFLKIRRKKIVTAELNSEYDVEYRPLGDGRWAILSRSTKISEMDGNKELPPGQGHGYLWRLNAVLAIGAEAGWDLSGMPVDFLTRDIPPGDRMDGKADGHQSVPKDSLQFTLEAARTALR